MKIGKICCWHRNLEEYTIFWEHWPGNHPSWYIYLDRYIGMMYQLPGEKVWLIKFFIYNLALLEWKRNIYPVVPYCKRVGYSRFLIWNHAREMHHCTVGVFISKYRPMHTLQHGIVQCPFQSILILIARKVWQKCVQTVRRHSDWLKVWMRRCDLHLRSAGTTHTCHSRSRLD